MQAIEAGTVLGHRERNMYDDSDFYTLVWSWEKNAPVEILTGSTRWAGGDPYHKVDATDEVKAAYHAWKSATVEKARAMAAEAQASDPQKGMTVEVVGGRKHKGFIGVVIWRGANQFRTYYANGYNKAESLCNQRVGVKNEAGEVAWVPVEQVRVIDAPYTPREAEGVKFEAELILSSPLVYAPRI